MLSSLPKIRQRGLEMQRIIIINYNDNNIIILRKGWQVFFPF